MLDGACNKHVWKQGKIILPASYFVIQLFLTQWIENKLMINPFDRNDYMKAFNKTVFIIISKSNIELLSNINVLMRHVYYCIRKIHVFIASIEF